MPKIGHMSKEDIALQEIERFRSSDKHKEMMEEREAKTRQWLINNPCCQTKELIEKYNIS